MKTLKEELEERISQLTKELELASQNAITLIPEQPQHSAELLSKLNQLEMQLQSSLESEQTMRNTSRDFERQIEVESNNARLVQDQYSSLKQM